MTNGEREVHTFAGRLRREAPEFIPLTAGKPKELALVACMRKLLTILNTIVHAGQPWTPNHYTVALTHA